MFDLKTISVLGCSVVALAACGGNGAAPGKPVVIGAEEELARYFSKNVGDAGDVIQDGDTLTARQIAMAGITLDYDDSRGGNTQITPMTEFTVRLNEDGELTFVMNGTEWAFVEADREVEPGGEVYSYFTQAQCDGGGACVSLGTWTGEIDDLKTNGNGYHEILTSQSNQIVEGDGALNLKAYAAVGTETLDADLPTLATATYLGYSRIDGYPSTGFVDNGTSRTRVNADMEMTANFGAGSISGLLDNIEIRDPGESDFTSVAGTISMNETGFTVNGYIGSLSADADFTTATGLTIDESSTYSGVFYGPGAEETGGVISATGLDDEGAAYNAVGFFTGDTYE